MINLFQMLPYLQAGKKDLRVHDYDAKLYVSSTTVLSCLNTGFNLSSIPEERLKMLSSRGTYIHEMADSIFNNKEPPIWELIGLDPKYKPDNLFNYELAIYKMFSQWKDKVKVILTEVRFLDEDLFYSFKPDMVWEYDGNIEMVDFKTISSPLQTDNIKNFKFNLSTKYWAQIASYLFGLEKQKGITINKGRIIAFDPDGKTYSLEKSRDELLEYFEIFKCCLQFYKETCKD